LTIRPPSKWSTEPSKSSPKAIGSYLRPDRGSTQIFGVENGDVSIAGEILHVEGQDLFNPLYAHHSNEAGVMSVSVRKPAAVVPAYVAGPAGQNSSTPRKKQETY
jgi:hypothetical protein